MGAGSEIWGPFYVDQSFWFFRCKSCPGLERDFFFGGGGRGVERFWLERFCEKIPRTSYLTK